MSEVISTYSTGKRKTAIARVWITAGGNGEVTVNGKRIRPGETNGYYTWQDKYTTYAVATVPHLVADEHEIAFTFQ